MTNRWPGLGKWIAVAGLALLAPGGGRADPPAAPQPLSSVPVTCTRKDYAALCLAWYRRTLGEAYDRYGRHDVAGDQDARKYLDLLAAYLAGTPDRCPPEQLLAAAQPVVDAHSPDPLLQYATALALSYNGSYAAAGVSLQAAVAGFKTAPYPRQVAWMAAGDLVALSTMAGLPVDPEVGNLRAQWFTTAVGEKLPPGQERAFLRVAQGRVSSWGKPSDLSKQIAALAEQPGPNQWVVEVLAGGQEVSDAWAARGSGWASSVTAEAWQKFREHLAQAGHDFEVAYALHPEFPEAAAGMIEVVLNDASPAEERNWFDRAVKAQFDWQPAYDRLVEGLRPRWGGSVEALRALADECLATGRFDTDAPGNYYLIMATLAKDEGQPGIWQEPEVYPKLKKLFDKMLAAPEHADQVSVWAARYAGVAFRTGNMEDVRHVFRLAGPGPDEPVLRQLAGQPATVVRGLAQAAGGPQGETVRQAEVLYQAGNVGAALPLFQQLLAAGPDPLVAPYLRDRVAGLQVEAALQKGGDWVSLLPAADFGGWDRDGQWTVTPQGYLQPGPDAKRAQVVCYARLGDNYEVQGQADAPSTAEGAGLEVGVGARWDWVTGVALLQYQPTAQTGWFQWQQYTADKLVHTSVAVAGNPPVSFDLVVRAGKATVTGDGKPLVTDAPLGMVGWPPGQQIALTAWHTSGPFALTFRELRVRRLSEQPVSEVSRPAPAAGGPPGETAAPPGSAPPQSTAPLLSDPLQGATVGHARADTGDGTRYVTLEPHGARLEQWDSWIRYTAKELPSAAGTLSFWVNLPKGFSAGMLVSDAYAKTGPDRAGTTWPSFVVMAHPASATTYTVTFQYWNSVPEGPGGNWHVLTSSLPLDVDRWYSLGVSWGPPGQSLWVNRQRAGYAPYHGAYQHDAAGTFAWWGLGAGGNTLTPGSDDPSAGNHAVHPAQFSELRLWDRQVDFGGTMLTRTGDQPSALPGAAVQTP